MTWDRVNASKSASVWLSGPSRVRYAISSRSRSAQATSTSWMSTRSPPLCSRTCRTRRASARANWPAENPLTTAERAAAPLLPIPARELGAPAGTATRPRLSCAPAGSVRSPWRRDTPVGRAPRRALARRRSCPARLAAAGARTSTPRPPEPLDRSSWSRVTPARRWRLTHGARPVPHRAQHRTPATRDQQQTRRRTGG